MFNPLVRKIPVCPECNRPAIIQRGQCYWCGEFIHVPVAYFRSLWLLTLVNLGGVGFFAFGAFSVRHIGTWLLCLLVLAFPVRLAWSYAIPPWIEKGEYNNGWPFAFFYVFVIVVLFIEWMVWGWLHVGLGATKSELSENWFFFSIPLCWVNSNFLIESDRWLSDAAGTILGNGFFYALVAFVLYGAVKSKLDRNRAIRLGITASDPKDKR